MGLETGTYISDLVSTNPIATDPKSQGDDHIRLIKATIKATFPNIAGAMNASHTELNYVVGVTSAIQTQLDAKGAIAGQVWTGAHNYTGGTITVPTQSAGDNSTKAASTAYVDTGLALKGSLAGATWTGTQDFTGATITVPTASPGDNSTKAASTAFVQNAAFTSALPDQAGNAGKFVTTDGANASWGFPVASQTEAEAGSSSTTLMTPERVSQAIACQSPNDIAILQDQKSSGTIGATLTDGVWTTRQINTEVYDPDGLVTLSSNQVTINTPGVYELECWAMTATTSDDRSSRSRIYDVSASAVVAYGPVVRQGTDFTAAAQAHLTHVIGVITVAATKTIRVETWSVTGLAGIPASSGDVEVYLTLVIRKKAGV